MEYIYAAMVLHAAKKPINEENINKVLQAAGINVDSTRVKALVAALEGINIEEAIKTAAPIAPAAAPAVAPAPEKKEEKKKEEEEKKEEAAVEGLASLFG